MRRSKSSSAAYRRPYGPLAPWNVPVAGLTTHADTSALASSLWNSGSNTVGNINIVHTDYTFPVYDVRTATGTYAVSSGYGNMDGLSMPWSAAWTIPTGSDEQVIVIDQGLGKEWNLFQCSFNGTTILATRANLVSGSFWTKTDGFTESRGCGIQYMAMLIRPQEIQAGVIRHAMSMPIKNPDGTTYVAPATKLEHPGYPAGIPEGTRFALNVTNAEIDTWVAALPAALPAATRRAAKIIGTALRDYGWFVTDTSGSAGIQLEERSSAGAKWDQLGLALYDQDYSDAAYNYKAYPNDMLDGLLTQARIYAIVSSDQY